MIRHTGARIAAALFGVVALSVVAACSGTPDGNGSVQVTASADTSSIDALANICPNVACGIKFDMTDELESQLSAIGCTTKVFIGKRGDRSFFRAFCPDGDANDALVAAYRHTKPYELRIVPHACSCDLLPSGMVVDEWDPGTCPSCGIESPICR